MANLGDISSILLPSGDSANIKDRAARSSIEDLFESVVHAGTDVNTNGQKTFVEGFAQNSYYINTLTGAVFKLLPYVIIGGESGVQWSLQFNLDKKWHFGTDITGTGSSTISSSYDAYTGDMYLNTDTMNLYECVSCTLDEFSQVVSSSWRYKCTLGGSGGTGAQWFAGTAITGTGTQTATISGANVGDMYLNTQSSSYSSCGYVYKCTATNTWVYQGVIKGPQGPSGSTGSTGRSAKWVCGTEVTGTSTSPSSQTTASCYQYDWYLNSDTYNIYSSNTGTDEWVYEGNIKGADGGLPTAFQRIQTSGSEYWRKVAATAVTGATSNHMASFLINEGYGTTSHKPIFGILRANCRTSSTGGQGATGGSFLEWLVASSGITLANFALLFFNNEDIDGNYASNSCRYEIWVKGRGNYSTYQITMLDALTNNRSDNKSAWELYSVTTTSSSGQSSLPSTASYTTYSTKMDIL